MVLGPISLSLTLPMKLRVITTITVGGDPTPFRTILPPICMNDGSSEARYLASVPLISSWLGGRVIGMYTMMQNFGGDGLSHYGVWFELH